MRKHRVGQIAEGSLVEPLDLSEEAARHGFTRLDTYTNIIAFCIVHSIEIPQEYTKQQADASVAVLHNNSGGTYEPIFLQRA